jgi:LacI family transcriptional regulator, galactose operon repressor
VVAGRPGSVGGRRGSPAANAGTEAGTDGAGAPASPPPRGHRAPRATIRDVAARAGVSTATVSRVLAGIGSPKASTAAAVMSAVEELDYRPSGVARSLRMRRTRTFGLIVTDIQNPFFPELVQSADLAARARGYSILLGSAAYDESRAMHYLDLMVDRRVDGLIIASSQLSEATWTWLASSPVPLVVVNAEPANLTVSLVTSDNVAGSRLAAQHLIDLGHRRIAYIRGAESFTADVPRLTGFRDACRAAGLPVSDTPEFRGDGQFEGGERATAQMLRDGCDVTAIACYNDVTAIGALRALRSAGRHVPGDVSVVGCDDIAAASWVAPALTTVAQQKAEMGRIAVERLISIVDDPEHVAAPETTRLSMILQVRESTGPVRPA